MAERLTEDDRWITDRFDVGPDGYRAGCWAWECPDCPAEYGEAMVSRKQAIDSAREHDEQAHRSPA